MASQAQHKLTLARKLGTYDATLIVIGGIVGSGIFMTPAVVAQVAHTTPLILIAWCLGGVIALAGGFVFAELAWRRCDVRGMYGYLRDAYHPMLAFMSGWTALFVTQTGGMAAAAVTFGTYVPPLTGLNVPPVESAIAAVVLLNAINCFGVREGGTTQNVLTLLKAAAIAAVICAGLFGPRVVAQHVTAFQPPSGLTVLALLAAALIPVLYSYDGWQTTAFLDGEFKDPRRSLPRALVLGVLCVVGLYVLMTVAGLRMLGAGGLAASTAPATDMMRSIGGPLGQRIVAAGIAVSTLGFVSNSILTSPRIWYAMAEDGLFFKQFAWLHPRSRVPIVGIIAQCVITVLITVSGKYNQILSYVVSMDFFFLALSGIALFIFRRRDRDRKPTGVTVPGDPWVTMFFIAVSAGVVVEAFVVSPRETAIGFGILLCAAPLYFIWAKNAPARAPSRAATPLR